METLRSLFKYEEKKDLLIIGDGWGSICELSEVGNGEDEKVLSFFSFLRLEITGFIGNIVAIIGPINF